MRWLPLLILFFAGCATADLRPDSLPNSADEVAGRTLLAQMSAAHGGRAAWFKQGAVRATLKDRWKPLMHTFAGPWPKNATPVELTFLAGQDDGRIHFLEVDQPDWGIQNWLTYTVEAGEEPKFKQSGKLEFWVPTPIYFVEAMFRVEEATTVYRMPPAEVGGKRYERVFATWGAAEPQKNVDQYVVWIDPETHQLAWLEYTVRDYTRWMTGLMAYENIVDANGFKLATTMRTVDEPGGKTTLHEYTVQKYEVGVDVPGDYVVPKPELSGAKY